jgi:hypothetical protein
MRMARRKIAPGIEDGNHGLAHDVFAPKALLLHALAMREASHTCIFKPATASQISQSFYRLHPPLKSASPGKFQPSILEAVLAKSYHDKPY